MKRKEKRCRNCGRYFRPGKFKPYAQHYCWDEECRQASHRAAKAKYRKKQSQSLEYRMKESGRVQGYQAKHPYYWKECKKSSKIILKDPLLRDTAQVEKLQSDMCVLRDIAIRQDNVIKGLISFTTGEVLRDIIAIECNRFYDRGKEVSGIGSETDFMSKIKNIGLHNETKSINRRPAQAQYS